MVDGPELAEGQHVRVLIDSEGDRASHAEVESSEEGVVHTPATPALASLLDQIRRTRPSLPPSPTGPGRKSAAGMLAADSTWDNHVREVLEARKSADYREIAE